MKPNACPERILAGTKGNKRVAQTIIRRELSEPLYALHNAEIRDGLWQVLDKIEAVAAKLDLGPEDSITEKQLNKEFRPLEPETVKILSCVATGGPGGEEGWYELCMKKGRRRALVAAVIGNVVCQQVYQHPFFGGSQADQKKLLDIGRQVAHADGTLPSCPTYLISLQNLRLRSQSQIRRCAQVHPQYGPQ